MPHSHNYLARFEFLIVLVYLLKYTDAQHIPQQKDYLEFAQREYNYVFTKRQHVREILDFLFFIQQANPGLLSFEMVAVNTGQRTKYYVEHRGLKKKQIEAMLGAIQHSVYTPKETSQDLVDTLLPLVASFHEVEPYKVFMVKKNKAVKKLPQRVIDKIIQLDTAINKRALVELEIASKPDKKYFFGPNAYLPSPRLIKGYIDRIYDHGNQPYLLINNRDNQKLESYLISTIRKVTIFDMDDNIERQPTPEERYDDPTFPDVDTNLQASVNPLPEGEVVTIQFRFLHSDFSYALLKASFRSYFKQNMPIGEERMESILSFVSEQNAEVNPDHRLKVIYIQFQVNSLTYVKWATSYDVARLIETMEPLSIREEIKKHYLHLLAMSNFTST